MRSPLKRSLLSAFVIATLLAALSCKDNSTDSKDDTDPFPIGNWGTLSIKADNVEVTPGNDQYNLLVNHGVYTFNKGGTGTAVFTYGSSSNPFTWNIEGNQINISGYLMEFTHNADTMTTIEPSTTEGGIRYPRVETIYLKNYYPVAIDPPMVQITAPANNSGFPVGASVSFTGTASDTQDGAITGSALVWSSDKDGTLGTGNSLTTSTLSANTHLITLTATDSDNNSSSAAITISVSGSAPVVNITSPTDGATFNGGVIHFEGSASDNEDGQLSGGSMVWTSDKDGQIGTGTSFNRSYLSVNTHLITLTATDSDNNVRSASITIHVLECLPDVYIQSPTDGASFNSGVSITFTGYAQECTLDSSAITGSGLVWTSDMDGQIGTGNSFSSATLSSGTHTITLEATGAHQTTGFDSIILHILSGDAP